MSTSNQELAAQFRIQSIPTVYAFKDGRPVDGFQGALPESQLKQFIDKLAGGGANVIDQALEQARALLDQGHADQAAASTNRSWVKTRKTRRPSPASSVATSP